MTPLALCVFLSLDSLPAARAGEPDEAFGATTSADVRSVDPDGDRHSGDGAYGRFDGDLDVGLGAGVSAGFGSGELGVGVRTTAHWYSSLGLFVGYAESVRGSRIERRGGAGIELEPLFLIRWSEALERGPAFWDLTLDSLSFGVGYFLLEPEGRGFGSRRGVELSLGLGLPLFAEAGGPWLEARAGYFLPQSEREFTGLVFLSWHFQVNTPLVRHGYR
jgi:hypothetical protein